jgi:hypothetical protein
MSRKSGDCGLHWSSSSARGSVRLAAQHSPLRDPLVSEDHFRRLERPAVVEFRYRVIPIPRIGASEGKRAKADASWFQRPPITVDTGAADREIRPHGPFGRMSLR